MQEIRIAGSLRHSSVNGSGVRYVLFFQGCTHHCAGCQNPETWDLSGGIETDTDTVLAKIKATKYLDGITLSGGDPLFQPEAAAEIARGAKSLGLTVWCYTGFTFEELLSGAAGESALSAVREMDVLVDGRFSLAEKTEEAVYRGSANQRLIDVSKSLHMGKIINYQV